MSSKKDLFAQWVHSNVGRRFSLRPIEGFKTYKDHDGQIRKMTMAPYNSQYSFIEHCREYMKENQAIKHGIPQIEFTDDYSEFKIYLQEKNFFYDRKV